jgi:hypothetical protein
LGQKEGFACRHEPAGELDMDSMVVVAVVPRSRAVVTILCAAKHRDDDDLFPRLIDLGDGTFLEAKGQALRTFSDPGRQPDSEC